MTDIFAILDAAVTEIGRRSRSKFPLFPSAAESEGGTGTSKHLENNGVPALPVVPAEDSIIQVGIEHIRENTPAEGNGNGDSAPTKYLQGYGNYGKYGNS